MPPAGALEAHGDVHIVAIEIIILDDHIAEMDASPKDNPVCLRLVVVCIGHRLLKFDNGAQCIDGAVELGERAITCQFDHATAMAGDGRPDALGKMCFQESVSATFIPTHQPRIAHDVYGDDNRKSALIAGQWHFLRCRINIIGSVSGWGNGQWRSPQPLQPELLRQVAHWLMKEPDLEEEALRATSVGDRIEVTRRTLATTFPPVTMTSPDGSTRTITLNQTSPGLAAVGNPDPLEFSDVRATETKLKLLVEASGDGLMWLQDNPDPDIRSVRPGRAAGGSNWIGPAATRVIRWPASTSCYL